MVEYILDHFKFLAFNLSSLLFLTLITIIYLRKKKFNKLENHIYRYLLIFTFIMLFLDIITIFTIEYRTSMPILNELLCRLFLCSNIICFTTMVIYTIAVTKNNEYTSNEQLLKDKIVIFFIGLAVVIFLVSCFLKIEYVPFISGFRSIVGLFADIPKTNNADFIVKSGPAINSLYIAFFFILIYLIYILIYNFKKKNSTKSLPILAFLLSYLFLGIIQLLFIDFNDLTYTFAYYVVALYFVIENQDLKLANELGEAKKEAEKSDRLKTEFLAQMSHEIRTPLNVILGYSETIINNKENDLESVVKENENIYEASKSLSDIINNILTYSKIESGHEEVDDSDYSLLEVIEDVSSTINAKINSENCSFDIELEDNIPIRYKGDKLKVHRILLNILNNFVQNTSIGKISLKVFNKIGAEGNSEIKFVINGIGTDFKEEFINYLKNSDISLSEKSEYSKVDLSLIVSKRLIELLNGRMSINVDSDINTTIVFIIPGEVVGNEKLKDYSINIDNSDIEYKDFSNYKVLYVDDNEINRKVMGRLLDTYKINYELLDSGVKCIDKIKISNDYDLIMIDHLMPEKDGVETFEILRKLNIDLPPVVVVTANLDSKIRIKLKEVGFNDYLAKPVDIKELDRILNKYLKGDR